MKSLKDIVTKLESQMTRERMTVEGQHVNLVCPVNVNDLAYNNDGLKMRLQQSQQEQQKIHDPVARARSEIIECSSMLSIVGERSVSLG